MDDGWICAWCKEPADLFAMVASCRACRDTYRKLRVERIELSGVWIARSGPPSLGHKADVTDAFYDGGGLTGYLSGEAPDPITWEP